MSNLNLVVLQGNLTRDPEVRFTESGLAIVKFAVAVNSGFGEKEEVSFIECTAFGKQGEALAKFFAKGKQILVEGRLRQERWQDKQSGANRSKLAVVVQGFHFVSGGKAATEGGETTATAEVPADATATAGVVTPASGGDDGKLF